MSLTFSVPRVEEAIRILLDTVERPGVDTSWLPAALYELERVSRVSRDPAYLADRCYVILIAAGIVLLRLSPNGSDVDIEDAPLDDEAKTLLVGLRDELRSDWHHARWLCGMAKFPTADGQFCRRLRRVLVAIGTTAEPPTDTANLLADTAYIPPSEIAKRYGISKRFKAFKKALERYRAENFQGWVQVHTESRNVEQFTFSPAAVPAIIVEYRDT